MSSTSILKLWIRAVVIASLGGCATQTAQAGLSNTPGSTRSWGPEDRGGDVISNGRDSCPSSLKREDDPLANRWPRCVENNPASGRTIITSTSK